MTVNVVAAHHHVHEVKGKKLLSVVMPSALKLGYLQECAAADRACIQGISFSLNFEYCANECYAHIQWLHLSHT